MNNSWTDRIKQFESPPPEKGFDPVAASLDDAFLGHEFPVKLYNLETEPPAGAWTKISESLPAVVTPVLPIRQNPVYSRVIRYALAACFLGIISFVAVKYFSAGKTKGDVALAKPDSAKDNNPVAGSNSQPTPKTAPSAHAATENEARALEDSKRTYARLDAPTRSLSAKISARLYSSPVQLSSSLSEEAGLEKNPEIQYSHRAAVNDSPEDKDATRYLMFKDSEGRFIKISKKLTSLFCCVSGEEQDENCNDQLKKWREKIASSSFIPSPDNFMDILDLVSSLQDNRN